MATTQRAYVRRLAKHGIAGLGLGLGFGFAEVPRPSSRRGTSSASRCCPCRTRFPSSRYTKAAVTHLASEQLEQLTRALGVHERLADSVLEGRGLQALLAILCNHLDCSLALLDEHGRVVAERHAHKRLLFDEALELPVVAGGQPADPQGDPGRCRVRRVRLAGPPSRTNGAGLRAVAAPRGQRRGAAARGRPARGSGGQPPGRARGSSPHGRIRPRSRPRLRSAARSAPERALQRAPPRGGRRAARARGRPVSLDRTSRPAAFLVGAGEEREVLALARRVAQAEPLARVAIGRPARGSALGRSLVEARAALDAATGTSLRSATSARSSCCSACPTPRSTLSSTACSAPPRRTRR